MRKNFYVKAEDENIFEQIGDENLSSLIAQLLRQYVAQKEREHSNLEECFFYDGLKRYRFQGRKLWPINEDSPQVWDIEKYTRWIESNPFKSEVYECHSVYITKKGWFLVTIDNHLDRETSHKVYTSLHDLLQDYEIDETSTLAAYLAYASGKPVTVDLDV